METDYTYYRIFCITEDIWVYKNSYSTLTVCPNDVFHIVNENSLQVIEPGKTLLNDGNYEISSTIDTTSPGIGSFVTNGGASVSKTLSVSGAVVLFAGIELNSTLVSGSSAPLLFGDLTNKKYVDDKFNEFHESSSEYFQNNTTQQTLIPGMSISPIRPGIYKVDYNGQFNTQLANMTEQTAVDLNVLYLNLTAGAVTNSVFPSFTGGTTINAGIYSSTPAVSSTGTVTFDGGVDDIFIFKITGAFNSAANNIFSLINGANASNVFFIVDGAVTLGADCNISGTFLSPSSALSLGASGYLNGKMMSKSGAVANSGTIIVPHCDCERPLGTTANFAMFAGIGDITNTGANIIVGDIGTNNGSVLGFINATLSGIIYLPSQGASLITFSICIDDVIVPGMNRERVNYIDIEDVILAGVCEVADDQVISIQIKNSIGISRIYNRFLNVRKLN